MLHGHFIIAAADLDGHSVIFKPSIGLGLASELTDSSRQPEVGRNHSGPDGSTKALWPRNMYSAAGWKISVGAFSVSSVSVDQTLNENRSRIKAWFPGVDWNPSPNTVMVSIILLLRRV